MIRRGTFVLALACALLGVGLPAVASRATAIKLSPTVGPPTTTTTVQGRAFGVQEQVDVRFDHTLVGSATTDSTGAFSTSISVPAEALPESHTVYVRGRTTHLKASAMFLVRTDWPKFHFDVANSGLNPYENVLDPSNVGGLVLDWRHAAAPSSPHIYGSVAVVGGKVYVAANGSLGDSFVSAFDASTGDLLWQTRLIGANTPSGVAVADGLLYVGTLGGYALHAIDAATGTPVWTFQASSPVNTPTVADGVVYVGSALTLYAIDALTGHKIWSFSNQTYAFFGAPAVVDGVLYFGSTDHRVYAATADTGQLIWLARTGDAVEGSPAVVDGVVYIGSNDHKLYAIDASSGTVLWSAETGDFVTSSPAVSNGLVYVGSGDFNLYAFDAATGGLVWKSPTGSYASMDPFVANGVVYEGSLDQRMYAFDAATGEQLWSYGAGGVPCDSGAVVDGRMYTGSQDGYLYAFALP